jgi:hypothetical protein
MLQGKTRKDADLTRIPKLKSTVLS